MRPSELSAMDSKYVRVGFRVADINVIPKLFYFPRILKFGFFKLCTEKYSRQLFRSSFHSLINLIYLSSKNCHDSESQEVHLSPQEYSENPYDR